MQLWAVKILSILYIGLFFNQIESLGQSCSECGSPRTYSSTGSTNVALGAANWSGNGGFSTGQIAKFADGRNYTWTANDFNLGGIILTNGSDLTLDRPNQGNNPSFTISNNCIVIGTGSILNLIYITSLENVSICIEEGGTLIMDSRSSARNDFIFEGVQINLQGPNSKIDFGDAEIQIEGDGLSINGWSGEDVCSGIPPTPPVSGSPSGNISWTGSTINICDLLNFNILPVEYLYFKSAFQSQGRAVKLTWATAMEWENSHFEIERSVNGVNNWEKIGQKEGMGWSDMPVGYEFADEELPLVGGNVYYRLKQVDFDATFSYSKVVSVKVPSLQLTKGVWRVYPNPTNGEKFRIELLNAKEYNGENVQIRLVTPIAGDKTFVGSNINEVSNQLEDFFKRVNKGVYVLEIFWGQKLEHVKVLKD
jgi:hypothetical protein